MQIWVAFLGQFVSNRDIGSLHLVHASGTMLNNCLCISYLGGLLHLGPHVLWSHFHNVGIQHIKYLIHTFCVYVFVLYVLVVLFRHGALEWVMVPDSTGLLWDWLGDVTSTVKFLSTFRGCVLPNESMHKLHASYRTMKHTMCVNYAFCIVYFVLIFCLCFCV